MSNLVSIEQFRRELHFHPFHFWQLAGGVTPIAANCDDLVHEYAWQGDEAGRDDIRTAIETAERKLQDYLGYSIAPHYTTYVADFPKYYDQLLHRISAGGADGRWLSVRLPEARVRSVGIQKLDYITTAAPTGIDSDLDGLGDIWIMSVATTVTNPDQIAVYFGVNDRVDSQPVGERWRILPIQVQIAGGIATIRGRMWQIVKPIYYQGVASVALNPGTPANFVTSIDIYRNYIDPTGTTIDDAQAKLIWETPPYPYWATYGTNLPAFSSNLYDPAAVAYAVARVGLRDIDRGIVSLGEAVYDTATGVWNRTSLGNSRPPDRVEIRYEAGDPLVNTRPDTAETNAPIVNGQINPKWITTVSRLAAAELGRRICACDTASKELYYWQIDRSFAGSAAVEKFNVSSEDLNNPFGTRNGQLYAWRQVKRLSTAVGLRV